MRTLLPLIVTAHAALWGVAAHAQEIIPADSQIGQAPASEQRVLLNPLETASDIPTAGSWRMKGARAVATSEPAAKVGGKAMRFQGDAEIPGGKGDFVVVNRIAGELAAVGIWVHLGAEANVGSLGFQVYDGEGEALMFKIPADWTGWRWVEADLASAPLTQAYAQKDKNGQLDQPVRGLNVFWFAKEVGPTALTVDGLVGLVRPPEGQSPFATQFLGDEVIAPNQAPGVFVLLTNFTDQPVECRLDYLLQRNPAGREPRLHDPRRGADRAEGKPSWLEVNGQRVDEGSLTDGSPYTGVDRMLDKPGYQEAFHTVDLGTVRTIAHLGYCAGDANWIWKMDVQSSPDGTAFAPVPGLQGIDLYHRWGEQSIPVPKPFSARFLRLRYHKDGEAMIFLRTPVSFGVYDGPADGDFALPVVGEKIVDGRVTVAVPPRTFILASPGAVPTLDAGAFLSAVQVAVGDYREVRTLPHFTLPPEIATLPADSQFGINGSSFEYPDINRRLGVGWVRFENMKWQMFCSAPDVFGFDGSIGPWFVRHDDYVAQYRERGIQVLPYTFQTPSWATSAPEGTEKNRQGWPPKNFQDYGEAMFQLVARYGSRQVPANALKTPDRQSGLAQIDTFELWNEPNLEGAGWAPWVGTMDQYYEIFRTGAEGAKRADPAARVSHAGYAGIGLDLVDRLRSYTYADGKHPLDFTDIINVHFYSGRQPPEISVRDRNANRTGTPAIADAPTFPENILALTDWRDQYAPGKEIWLTETGYDVGGPIGLGERDQAAKVPRVTMLSLAAGVEKVFIYREKGSNPAMHAGAGLCRNDDSLRPAWFTYATLIRQFVGVKPGRALRISHDDPNVWIHLWERDGQPLLTAWTVAGEGLLGLDLGDCRVTDSFGHAVDVAAGAPIVLGEFPVYVAGFAVKPALAAKMAEAKAREQKRQDTLRRDANRRAYLFDFGSTEYVGTFQLGGLRPFIAVMSTDVFAPGKEYGFVPKAMVDNTAKWMSDNLDKDSTRIGKGQSFQFAVKPGRYQLSLKASPLGERASLAVDAGGDPLLLPITPEKPREAYLAVLDLEVAGPIIRFTAEDYVDLRWLQLVEAE
jgi:hypothetical protein